MEFNALRHQHSEFSYQSFSHKFDGQKLRISFVFKTEPDIFFKPSIIISPISQKQLDDLGPALNNFIFNLGMSEIPSYWKATCSPIIQINCGYLKQDQISFWHKLLIKGMGQFFYENKIDFTKKDFVKISLPRDHTRCVPQAQHHTWCEGIGKTVSKKSPKYLVPLGGGKDSLVAVEILKKANLKPALFILNPNFSNRRLIAQITGCQHLTTAKRSMDPRLLALNKAGYLNGHVPITAFTSFLSLLVAALTKHNQVIFSHESSSEEENLVWKGAIINHQYSKSLEFENDFRAYYQQHLTNKINSFSFLRPLSELQITKIFTSFPQYFSVFRSCNLGQAESRWCGNCSKCLAVYLYLSAFLPPDTVVKIFGQNLFANVKLLPTFRQLLGIEGFKPFECVGTIDENLAAAWLVLQKVQKPLPLLLQTAHQYLKSLNYNQNRADKILANWNNNHNLPRNLEKILLSLRGV